METSSKFGGDTNDDDNDVCLLDALAEEFDAPQPETVSHHEPAVPKLQHIMHASTHLPVQQAASARPLPPHIAELRRSQSAQKGKRHFPVSHA